MKMRTHSPRHHADEAAAGRAVPMTVEAGAHVRDVAGAHGVAVHGAGIEGRLVCGAAIGAASTRPVASASGTRLGADGPSTLAKIRSSASSTE